MNNNLNNLSVARPSAKVAIYTGLMVAGAILGFCKTVVFSKVMGIVGFGYYSVFILAASYGTYACNLGILDGLLREVSLLRGRNDELAASDIRNKAAGAILVFSLSSLFVYCLFVLFFSNGNWNRTYILLMAGLFSAGTAFFMFGTLDLRTSLRVVPFSAMIALKAGISLFLGLIAVWLFGWQSIVVVEILVVVSLFLIIRFFLLKNFKFQLSDFAKIRRLVKTGFPIMLGNFTRNIALNIDRWFTVSIFGVSAFSQYSFGMIIATAGMVVSNIIGVYIGPGLLHEFGRTNDLLRMKHRVYYIVALIFLLFVAAWIPFIFAIDIIGAKYFPEYSQGISLMRLIYIGVMFQTMNMFDWVFIASNKTYIIFNISLGVGLLILAVCALASIFNSSLIEFAAIYSVGRAVHFLLGGFFQWKI
ncbi:hypothetical protein KAU11_05275 [Candidatus Babeliales bacterium]|nr:hypothetical protein [Candidatus Babeliales bacterium]